MNAATLHRKYWVTLIGLACVATLAACCSGCLMLLNFGSGVIETELQQQLVASSTLTEHVGVMEWFEVDWSRSLGDVSEDVFVYAVRGSKAEGFVIAHFHLDEEGHAVLDSAELEFRDGRTIKLDLKR